MNSNQGCLCECRWQQLHQISEIINFNEKFTSAFKLYTLIALSDVSISRMVPGCAEAKIGAAWNSPFIAGMSSMKHASPNLFIFPEISSQATIYFLPAHCSSASILITG